MKNDKLILGVDAGSVSISVILLDRKSNITFKASAPHNGEIKQTLSGLIQKIDLNTIGNIASTSCTPDFINQTRTYDDHVTMIRAAKHLHKKFDAILHIGGERFSLSHFDSLGNYVGAKHNTSCAAGTGSFLDQQARRLNLFASQDISEKALQNRKAIPDIATRCAVFAKTDLIHAQQEGYDIQQICDGLCKGLAKNITNTLFKSSLIDNKILFCGGVSQNNCVKNHLEKITKNKFHIDEYAQFYGAVGAALSFLDEIEKNDIKSEVFLTLEDIFCESKKHNASLYPGLEIKLSDYPDFVSFDSYIFEDVETDIYLDPSSLNINYGFIGLDVGSTSTKSIIIDENGNPVAGFYTKTASRPVQAVQKLFKACDNFFDKYNIKIEIKGCGTTGSGRRISAKIIGADIEPDEITAHATAAVNLNKDVDTIIEIGGQDAKFTLLKDGMVTSSVMNTVCAAGTGSFIEEQALKLSCNLAEYSSRAESVKSPVSSDRCTVFMERDINHYFAEGFKKNEILASVLHSVRDNYLTKVANIGKIGNCILFQGATAKNRALIAAFEQKLGKPIHVSRFCHLTGALGVALLAMEQKPDKSQFRGFQLWKNKIPIRRETCELCTNHCKLTIADIENQTIAYGFLCGRDYQTKKMVAKKKQYDLLKLRQKVIDKQIIDKQITDKPGNTKIKHDFTIGIPAALHLFEDIDLWQQFFSNLGIKTISSKSLKNPVKLGKITANAEFCAPVVSLHGHVDFLMKKADYLFMPFYFEEKSKTKDARRQHCYYTQFAPSLFSCLGSYDQKRILSPTIKYLYTSFHTKLELYKMLKGISSDFLFSFFDISSAYDKALAFKENNSHKLKELFIEHEQKDSKIKAVLLGRPYTILSKSMNNNIPGIFENLGVKTFFQDMLDYDGHNFSQIEPLLKEIHWKHTSKILKAAFIAATSDDLYPVYISSFKCAPDSFGVDYFKQIMEHFNKPYLVLELDEHDSSVGYETRVEAAVRAFTNHHNLKAAKTKKSIAHINPSFLQDMGNKTIIFPNWDFCCGSLLVAILKNQGYNAILMDETKDTLKKSMLTNTGQCIPLNAIAAGFIHTVNKNNLDPADCVLWLNPSQIACNIKMYPHHIKQILEKEKNGFELSGIYKGELTFFDISFKASTNAYFAYMFGGLLRSIGCKVRPYEVNIGETDKVLETALKILGHAFEYSESKETALKRVISLFTQIETKDEFRPKVGIFGDLYVRDNDVMNQDLVHFIEENGGEVIITPYYKYAKIIAQSYFKKWFKEGRYHSLISNKALFVTMQAMEKKYYKIFEPFFSKADFELSKSHEDILPEYGIHPEHTGESMDNILKIHHIVQENPDMHLLVQTNPAFCCPGLVTEAMGQKIEAKTGIPIVSITYDVSGGNKNKVIIPFLANARKRTYTHSHKVSV